MNLNSLLPHQAQSTQNSAAIALEKKWQRTGLLEGMGNEIERRGMAVLLENQARQLVTEANATATSANAESIFGNKVFHGASAVISSGLILISRAI